MLKQRPLAGLSYRHCGPVASITIHIETTLGIKNHALIPSVTPRNRALCRFQHFRPNPHNNRFQVVIVITLQQFTNIPQHNRRDIYKTTQTSQEYNLYNRKIQITAKYKIVSDYGQDTNWTKSPEDNRWRPIPAQAKPEGFPS